MLLPRSSAALRAAPRAVPAAAPRLAAAAVPRRGMVTAAERWNEEDWHNAHALVKDNSISLDKNIRDIESKWKHMSKPEQIGTWVLLEDIMKKDWNELTFTEKRAAYFISYGPYGPRKETPPGFHTKVALGTLAGIIAAIAFTTSIQRLGGTYARRPAVGACSVMPLLLPPPPLGPCGAAVVMSFDGWDPVADVLLPLLFCFLPAFRRRQEPPCNLEPRVAGGHERESPRAEERPYHWCCRRGLQGVRVPRSLPLVKSCIRLVRKIMVSVTGKGAASGPALKIAAEIVLTIHCRVAIHRSSHWRPLAPYVPQNGRTAKMKRQTCIIIILSGQAVCMDG